MRAEINASACLLKNLKWHTPHAGVGDKLAIAVAFYDRPYVLILDEPTNHLDSETVTALATAFSTFKGTAVCVSHDEAYVQSILAPGAAEHSSVIAVSEKTLSQQTRGGGEYAPNSAIYVLSDQRVRRFKGTFREYKQTVMKNILAGFNT